MIAWIAIFRKPTASTKQGDKKMFKKRTLLIALFLILLSTGIAQTQIPTTHASLVSTTDKTLSILHNVIGLDTSKYSLQLNSQINDQISNLPENNVDLSLLSDANSFRVSARFINNTLQLLYLTDYNGTAASSTSDTISAAQDFLLRYQAYTQNALYGKLASMLNVKENVNSTKVMENLTLKISISNSVTDYTWTYTDANGIQAVTKNVVLSYYQGQLNCFINNWPLYTIEGKATISRQQAIDIAISVAQDYTYVVSNDTSSSTVQIKGFTVSPNSLQETTLSYVNSPDVTVARNNNPFVLYPSWYVPLGFDKFYPGDVTGVSVSIWADTGKVGSIGPMTGDSGLTTRETTTGTTAQNSITASTLTIVIALALSMIALLTIRNKLINAFVKKKLLKFTLCGILLFAMCSPILISTVKADTVFPNSSARIYGALNGGGGSPPQLQEEKDAAYWVQTQINSAFSSSGYSSIDNAVGSRTTWYNEVTNAYYDSTGYDRFAVFHFGHLADFGAGYVDNTGNPIWYSDISPRTTSATKAFVFIWVCAQAQWGPTNNEVQAWMHNPNLSANGYSSPDSGSKAFIGFENFSPLISDYHQNFQQQWTLPSKYFIKYFYDNALLNGYSIRDAINQASISFFSTTYTNSIFNTGYLAWFPNDGQWHEGAMKIYGNGATFLFQPRFTFATNIPASVTFTVNSRQVGLGATNLWNTVIYTISANSVPGYVLDHIDYGGQTVGNPFTIQANSNKVITAYYNPI
jgi:hypothetical protein